MEFNLSCFLYYLDTIVVEAMTVEEIEALVKTLAESHLL